MSVGSLLADDYKVKVEVFKGTFTPFHAKHEELATAMTLDKARCAVRLAREGIVENRKLNMKKIVLALIVFITSTGLLMVYAQGAPYGKIMLGTKWPQTKPYWEAQGIQPIIDIDTSYLIVGHVDELFMWITSNKLIYADPWKAADLLHKEIAEGRGLDTIWFGWTVAGKNTTIVDVVTHNRFGEYLPVALDGTATNVMVTFGPYSSNSYLRVNDEILRVVSVSGNTHVLARAQANRPAMPHASNDVIYALSALMVKNLIDGGVANVPVCVDSKINVSLDQLKEGLGSYANTMQFIPVPVLFNEHPNYPTNQFLACTANLANSLVVNNWGVSAYYSNPGNQKFRNYFTSAVPNSVAVDVWEHYHCKYGEIHCATATVRSLPAAPPWWEQLPANSPWRTEQ